MAFESKKLSDYHFEFKGDVRVNYKNINLDLSQCRKNHLPEMGIPVLLFIAITQSVNHSPGTKQLIDNFGVKPRRIYYTLDKLRERNLIITYQSGVLNNINNSERAYRLNPEKIEEILEIFGVKSLFDLYKNSKY